MAFERIALFGIIDVDLESTGVGSLTLSTDLPTALAVRETKPIPVTTRRVLRFRLKGTTKGHLYKLKIDPGAGQIRLYGGRIWARTLPDGQWNWHPIPMIETPVEYQAVPLPIPATPQEWTAAKLPIPEMGEWARVSLPIPPTSEEWTPARLPIPETPEFSRVDLPIKPTPANPEWIDIPVDQ